MSDKKKDLNEDKKTEVKQAKEKPEINEAPEKQKVAEEKKETNKKKLVVPIIVLTIAICAILLFSVIFALLRIGNEKILSGVTIRGVDVSNLSKEEAVTKMQELVRK